MLLFKIHATVVGDTARLLNGEVPLGKYQYGFIRMLVGSFYAELITSLVTLATVILQAVIFFVCWNLPARSASCSNNRNFISQHGSVLDFLGIEKY